MKQTHYIYALMLLLVTQQSLCAQDTMRLGLKDVFAVIDKNYPQLQYYTSKISSIRAMAEGAKAWMPPTVAVALDRFPYRLSMLKEQSADNQAGIMVSFQQMIPNAAKLNAKRDYILSLENAQHNDLEWQKNVLHFTARLYYYRRYTAERKLRIISEYRGLLNMLIKTAKDKYTYNQADLGTIFKGEATLTELANMETMLLSQIAESSIGLSTLMNDDIYAIFNIDTLLAPIDYSSQYLHAADTSQLIRNDILSMQSQINAMQLNKKLAATASKPDFGIQVSHSQMFGMGNQFSIMGMMTLPIFSWSSKMYKSEVKSMSYEIEAMQKQTATMQLMAKQMIREKLTMLMYARKQLDNYENNILPSYRKNMESSLLSYRQNTGSFFVLLDAWNMLFMKELERMDKLGEVFTTQSEFEYQNEIK